MNVLNIKTKDGKKKKKLYRRTSGWEVGYNVPEMDRRGTFKGDEGGVEDVPTESV